MAKASDLIKQAEDSYGQPLTPDSTMQIRDQLQKGIAEALGFLANIMMCDYLNQWNGATEANLDAAQLAVDRANCYADVAIAHYAQGFIYRARGNHMEAQAAFKKSWDRNPASVRARAQWAAEMLYNGEFAGALREIDSAITDGASSPALGMFQWIKGRTLFFMADYESAIPCLQASIDSWPDLWYSKLYLVSAYAQSGDIKTAGELLKKYETGYDTIAKVRAAEGTNPNTNQQVEEGRGAFHHGLALAGMPPG
jgi:tetratricopeptide (TPR) repeat protein